MDTHVLKRRIELARIFARAVYWVFFGVFRDELRRGTLLKNIWAFLFSKAKGDITEDMSWAELLEERGAQVPNKVFLYYNYERFTYRQMNQNADHIADLLLAMGGGKGKGIGIFMRNSPRYLDIFFGAQKIGMYVLLINAELRGDGLSYVINHSDIEYLVLDAELIEPFSAVSSSATLLKKVIVNDIEKESEGYLIPDHMVRLSDPRVGRAAANGSRRGYHKDDVCLIIYTSGTTGNPKGVVYRYGRSSVKKLSIIAGFTLTEKDIYYTCLPLSHGNALFMTVTVAMAVRASVALGRKFSARNFWDDIRKYNATVFNATGSIIPILMKQPERLKDRLNHVRYVLSSACPAHLWERFEKRFGVKIYEAYSAVDGGGKGVINYGSAPVGSFGKPSGFLGKFRVIDEDGNDVRVGATGELIYEVGIDTKRFEYYKSTGATSDKVREGWLYTGDLVWYDSRGYFYFAGRKTDSMRRGGMNVSAHEVESVIMKHPAVEEVAVYPVPSELSEDEIMAAVKLVDGHILNPQELIEYLEGKLARYAIPRFIRFVDEFTVTSTYRIIKDEIKKEGVTPDSYDARVAAVRL
ncbi:MAG: AMP-binding protein [Spirochaetes bacterium]|nr:AMP-binding protein [Spirochaetota bacterium]